MKGKKYMNVLKIDSQKKSFFNTDGTDKIITNITKEDILKILELIFENDDITFDEYSDDKIANEAEKVIYKHLYTKFVDFQQNKLSLKNEIDSLFSELTEKYILEDA